MAKIIGVDFDDVIVSTNTALAMWHNRVHGTSYQMDHILTYDLTKIWGCSKEEMHRRIYDFFDSHEHTMTPPILGAVRALKLLKDKKIHVVTARQEEFRALTLFLAEQHVPFLSNNFHFPNSLTAPRTKAQVCEDLGVEVFIDDHLEYARDVASVGIPVFLFDTPWNQTNNLPHNVERVHSWEEIVQKLK